MSFPEEIWRIILNNVNNSYKGILRLVCKQWELILESDRNISLIEIVRTGRINLVKWGLQNSGKSYYKYKTILLYEAASKEYNGIFSLLVKENVFFQDNIFIQLALDNNINGLKLVVKNGITPSERTKKELLIINKNIFCPIK